MCHVSVRLYLIHVYILYRLTHYYRVIMHVYMYEHVSQQLLHYIINDDCIHWTTISFNIIFKLFKILTYVLYYNNHINIYVQQM